jgi:hypothetical protein
MYLRLLIFFFLLVPEKNFSSVLSYESFAGYSSSSIVGQNKATTGYSGGWAGTGNNAVSGYSLVLSNTPKLYNPSNSGSLQVYGPATVSRGLNIPSIFSAYSTDGININKGKLYMSFLMDGSGQGSFKIGSLSVGRFTNIDYSGGSSGVFGIDLGGDNNADYILPNIDPRFGTTLSHTQWTRNFILELNLATGNDSISFWLDPISATESSSPDLVISSADISFNNISVFSATSFSRVTIDELYFGTTFSDVLMIPEASAISLLAVGLGGLAMMRRRRS